MTDYTGHTPAELRRKEALLEQERNEIGRELGPLRDRYETLLARRYVINEKLRGIARARKQALSEASARENGR